MNEIKYHCGWPLELFYDGLDLVFLDASSTSESLGEELFFCPVCDTELSFDILSEDSGPSAHDLPALAKMIHDKEQQFQALAADLLPLKEEIESMIATLKEGVMATGKTYKDDYVTATFVSGGVSTSLPKKNLAAAMKEIPLLSKFLETKSSNPYVRVAVK